MGHWPVSADLCYVLINMWLGLVNMVPSRWDSITHHPQYPWSVVMDGPTAPRDNHIGYHWHMGYFGTSPLRPPWFCRVHLDRKEEKGQRLVNSLWVHRADANERNEDVSWCELTLNLVKQVHHLKVSFWGWGWRVSFHCISQKLAKYLYFIPEHDEKGAHWSWSWQHAGGGKH